jgi:CRP-like cAMP-binding protein
MRVLNQFKRNQHLVREGDRPEAIFRLEDGWACRYRKLAGGRRQITALFLPGEFCEPQWVLGESSCSAIVALTPLRVERLLLSELRRSGAARGDGVTTMLSATLGTLRRQSDWIVSLGRKTAIERLCWLFGEIFDRSRQSGQVVGSSCPLPVTQADIADVIGLTPIHVNRVIKQMKADGLIELDGGSLRIPDLARLQKIGSG